jgi:hypothetical protein
LELKAGLADEEGGGGGRRTALRAPLRKDVELEEDSVGGFRRGDMR